MLNRFRDMFTDWIYPSSEGEVGGLGGKNRVIATYTRDENIYPVRFAFIERNDFLFLLF